MDSRLFDRGSLPALEALMHFTTARHKAVANNIANAETPGYRPIDAPEADFKAALARAYEGQRATRTGVFQLEAQGGVRPTTTGLDLRFLETGADRVDLDMEMARMVKNAGRHNLAASIYKQQMTMLREAISERILP